MDTISHGAWAYLASHNRRLRWFVTAGSLFPDAGLFAVAAFLTDMGRFELFSDWLPQLFNYPFMEPINNTMHSIITWTGLFTVSYIFKWSKVRWFIYGVYLHIGIDILTHKTYLPEYFFPISDIKIAGFVDYHSLWFYLADITLLLISFYLLRRRQTMKK